jgi:SSS family solute:Na+ symporter
MTGLDWSVIGAYLAGMLAIGWHYSRRTVTTDDYLLGGRNMGSLSVGLSLFATMLSTITYLAWPGWVIKNGPMMMAMAVGLPPVYVLAGWFLIPRIMKLKITSANELLEARLGVSVRVLGAVFFLSMRLAWMAVIIFATTDKILVPLLGLEGKTVSLLGLQWPPTPVLCAGLAAITIVYTSMGGLRAVVVTDVTQTLILFGGAILTLVLISIRLGGVTAWWPTEWAENWETPVWGYSSTARVTFLGAALAQFTWWICTAGSDQMAIQRYLATRDAKAARGVLLTTLVANVLVYSILCAAGLALLAFFRTHPEMLVEGQGLLEDADTLFPRFIEVGMPTGISGLVVAALLAAAMSSLSSGVNSSCSIITVDFVDRFRSGRGSEVETDHVRVAKVVSVFVGLIVIGLTLGVGSVKGDLLEVTFKVVNLLTAPLFGLFFMAIFVRWATSFGTIVGAVCGVGVIAAINYWEEMTGVRGISFIWAMPLGFAAQIAVGSLVSLLPIGRSRPCS